MLGNFREMLEEMTTSPAMLFYLDNVFSSADGRTRTSPASCSSSTRWARTNYYGAIPASRCRRDNNGVPLGYIDEDVRELARCLTGWSLDERNRRVPLPRNWHDNGAKQVIGLTIPADQPALKDVSDVLDLLASPPRTARFVCTKLCRRLMADDPPLRWWSRQPRSSSTRSTSPTSSAAWCGRSSCRTSSPTPGATRSDVPSRLVISAVRAMGPVFSLPLDETFSRYFCLPAVHHRQSPVHLGAAHRLSGPEGGLADHQRAGHELALGQPAHRRRTPGLATVRSGGCDPGGPRHGGGAGGLLDRSLAAARRSTTATRNEIIDFMAQGRTLMPNSNLTNPAVVGPVAVHGRPDPDVAPLPVALRRLTDDPTNSTELHQRWPRGHRVSSSSIPRSRPATGEPDILVVVFLRGGMDGLNLVPPVSGSDRSRYEVARPSLAVPLSGDGAALTLDGGFGLHPAAAPLLRSMTAVGWPLSMPPGCTIPPAAISKPRTISNSAHPATRPWVRAGSTGTSPQPATCPRR